MLGLDLQKQLLVLMNRKGDKQSCPSYQRRDYTLRAHIKLKLHAVSQDCTLSSLAKILN
jgi:hypothetical protein